MIKKILIVFLCLIFISITSCASVGEGINSADESYVLEESDEPEPYSEEEFPRWLRTIRRAEIILVGTLPFSILLSNTAYSIYQNLSSDLTDGYSIENFADSSLMTTEDRVKVLQISLSVSGTIAAADMILGFFEKDDEE